MPRSTAPPPADEYARKLHPWLRVVTNGDQAVNAVRSDGSARMASAVPADAEGQPAAPIYEQLAQQVASVPRWTEQVAPPSGRLPKQVKLSDSEPATDSYVNVLFEFFPEQLDPVRGETAIQRMERQIQQLPGAPAGAVATQTLARRNLLCATVPVAALQELSRDPAVAFVHPSEPLALDRPELTAAPPGQ